MPANMDRDLILAAWANGQSRTDPLLDILRLAPAVHNQKEITSREAVHGADPLH